MIERDVRFTDDDMVLFAAGSGDTSPLHTDHAYARGTVYGECIVYGGLLTIALLGLLPDEVRGSVRTIRSSFPGPVLIGSASAVRALEHPSRPGTWEIKLHADGATLARVVADSRRDARGVAADGPLGGAYSRGPELDQLVARFGADGLHSALLDGIGWASNLVGMGMPDFQGLCAAVELTTASDEVTSGEPCASGRASINDHDERSNRRLLEGTLVDAASMPRTITRIECFPIPEAT